MVGSAREIVGSSYDLVGVASETDESPNAIVGSALKMFGFA